MRHSAPLALAILACCAAFNVQAADNSGDPCTLLDSKDFQSLGAFNESSLVSAGWHKETTPTELPGSVLLTNLCAAVIRFPEGRTTVVLNFDSFKGKVTEKQVGAWLKTSAAEDKLDGETDVKVAPVGDAICESGRYELPTTKSREDDTVMNVVEYYVACDQQVGMNHVSLNVHVPEGKKSDLPSADQAKALLDKSISRMSQNKFTVPDAHD